MEVLYFAHARDWHTMREPSSILTHAHKHIIANTHHTTPYAHTIHTDTRVRTVPEIPDFLIFIIFLMKDLCQDAKGHFHFDLQCLEAWQKALRVVGDDEDQEEEEES